MELECQDTPYVPLDSLSLPAWPHPCRRGFQQEGANPGGGRGWEKHAGLATSLLIVHRSSGVPPGSGDRTPFLTAQGAGEVSVGQHAEQW